MSFVYVNPSVLRKGIFARFFRLRSKSRILFLDADGVLWPDQGAGTILKSPEISDAAIELISKFRQRHKGKVAIITNQTAAARGLISLSDLKEFLHEFFHNINSLVSISVVCACLHHPTASELSLRTDCMCRKPKPGGILEVFRLLSGNPRDSFLVGDRISDIIASNESGIPNSFLLFSEKMFTQNVTQNESSFAHARSTIFLPVSTLVEVEIEIAKIVRSSQ